eukprot:1226-Heterococcus_DN1.PRE.1
MAHSTKYNVFKSQLHGFASRCNHWSTFADNAKRLLTEMTAHGYEKSVVDAARRLLANIYRTTANRV